MIGSSEVSSLSYTRWGGDEDEFNDDLGQQRQLFGRTEEVVLLRQTFEKVLRSKNASTVVVHGMSGLGKTSLVDTLRVPVLQSGGYFCAGKFFQNSEVQEPFSAIMAAFSDVCDVVAQSEDLTDKRKNEIQAQLGDDGYLLTRAISNITAFLLDGADGLSDEALDLVITERTLSKFNDACKTFLRAMSSDQHPLVIFLDDIQWMDVGSRQLIELFIADKELTNVLLILAYRDDEAEKATSILEQHEDKLVDIQLESLDSRAVYEMVSALTGEESERMQELSELVLHRSKGNPFHVLAFLEMIEHESLLRFDPNSSAWVFDVYTIQTSVMINSDVAEILSRKIELANHRIKEALKIASILGYKFSATMLEMVFSSTKSQALFLEQPVMSSIAECLSEAVEIGFVEKIKTEFQFTHDQIQTAFRNLIHSDDEAECIHGIIGGAILALGENSNATAHQAAVHLNCSSKTFASEEDRRRLVTINLRAARHCMSKSAFAAAGDLLQKGLALLGPTQKWLEFYFDLTFEMTELLARTELVTGNFEGCKEATRDTILHAKSTEMKINSLVLDVEARLTSHNDFDEFIQCTYSALDAVGVDMPRRVSKRHVLLKFLSIKKKLRKKTDSQILSMPRMNDKLALTAISVLSNLCTSCFFQDETNLALYSALTSMEQTLTHGLSEGTSMSLVIFAVVELAVGNGKESYRYAKLAMKLLENQEFEFCDVGFTVCYAGTLLTWRKEPLSELRHQILEAAEIGFQDGGIFGGTFCSSQAFIFESMMGGSLHNLEASLRRFVDRLSLIGDQDAMLLWVQPTFQFVLNLQRYYSNWKDVLVLTGEVMDENQFLLDAKKVNEGMLRRIALSFKFFLACYFRYFEEAVGLYKEADSSGGNSVKLSYGQISTVYALSLAHFELYRTCGKRTHLGKARKYKKRLERLAAEGSPDASTHAIFVSAVEKMALKKKNTDKQELVDTISSALSHLGNVGNYRLQGLLNEHAGFDRARRGHLVEANAYFAQAQEIYRYKWCSYAKHEWLVEQTAQYKEAYQIPSSSPATQVGGVIVCTNSNQEE